MSNKSKYPPPRLIVTRDLAGENYYIGTAVPKTSAVGPMVHFSMAQTKKPVADAVRALYDALAQKDKA